MITASILLLVLFAWAFTCDRVELHILFFVATIGYVLGAFL